MSIWAKIMQAEKKTKAWLGVGMRMSWHMTISYKALIKPQSYYIDAPRSKDIAKLLEDITFKSEPPVSTDLPMILALSSSMSGGMALLNIILPDSNELRPILFRVMALMNNFGVST